MIKIERSAKPLLLTTQTVKELTDKFKETQAVVWKNGKVGIAIEKALLLMSHQKCCYCECELKIENSYLNVEHFYPKSIYPDEVLIWVNLLPCCPSCNSKKSAFDTKKNAFIKPDVDDPREHLQLEGFFITGKTDKGISTQTELKINAINERVKVRSNLYFSYLRLVEPILKEVQRYCKRKQLNGMKSVKETILDEVRGLLEDCLPTSPYAAFRATKTLNDTRYYQQIKALLQEQNIWTPTLAALEQEVKQCALDYIPS